MPMHIRLIFIAFFSLFTAHIHAQAVPCETLWAAGYPNPNPTDPAGTCHKFIPTITTLGPGQEMYIRNSAIDDSTVKEYMEWAADAFTYSSSKYEAYASVPKTRIIWSELPYAGDVGTIVTRAFSYVEFFNLGSEYCPIVIYPAAMELSKDHFYQMLAHEVYHCVQKVNFPAQVAANASGTGEGHFWLESIAQLASNEVYPTYDFEYSPIFGPFDGHLPFFEQSSPYLSEGFFQSLLWFMGGDMAAVHSIQGGFSTSGAPALDEALSIPRISESFHEAARKISFKELQDSSGALAPWTAEKQIHLVPDTPTSSISISFMDFATEPFEITFPKGGRYRLNIHTIDGAKLSVRKKGTTEWQTSFQTDFLTECDSERTLEGIYTRASSELALNALQIEIIREDNPACPCVVDELPKDKCLVGDWELEPQTMTDFMRLSTGGVVTPIEVTGRLKAQFTASGDYQWDYQNLRVVGQIPSTRDTRTMTWIFNGIHSMKYSSKVTSSARWLCSRGIGSTVSLNIVTVIAGRTFNTPGQYSADCEGTFQYRCDARTFYYDAPVANGVVTYRFRRLSAPPSDL